MTNLKTTATVAAILGGLVAASGCLLKDQRHTWYVDPDGSVTWQIIEKDVRSDADSVVDRQREEAEYRAAVGAQQHPVARGLGRVGGTALRTRILRNSVPLTVVTEARFPNLGQLGQLIVSATRTDGASVLERTADGYSWTFTMANTDQDAGESDLEDISALLGGFETLQVVLTEGRFTAAQRFDLGPDKRVASLKLFGSHEDVLSPEPLVMSLSWTTRR